MNVAIKFCGGCNPGYDRVAYWEAIRASAKGRIRWVGPDDPLREAVLVLCGCETACPVREMPQDGRIIPLTNDSQPAAEVVSLVEKVARHPEQPS